MRFSIRSSSESKLLLCLGKSFFVFRAQKIADGACSRGVHLSQLSAGDGFFLSIKLHLSTMRPARVSVTNTRVASLDCTRYGLYYNRGKRALTSCES